MYLKSLHHPKYGKQSKKWRLLSQHNFKEFPREYSLLPLFFSFTLLSSLQDHDRLLLCQQSAKNYMYKSNTFLSGHFICLYTANNQLNGFIFLPFLSFAILYSVISFPPNEPLILSYADTGGTYNGSSCSAEVTATLCDSAVSIPLAYFQVKLNSGQWQILPGGGFTAVERLTRT